MHELALMQSLVETVGEQVGDSQVAVVRLEVGQLTCVLPEALRFCFDVCARDTKLERATLEIVAVAARGRCRRCGEEQVLESVVTVCGCGSHDLQVLSGQELRVREVEVDDVDVEPEVM